MRLPEGLGFRLRRFFENSRAVPEGEHSQHKDHHKCGTPEDYFPWISKIDVPDQDAAGAPA